MKTLLIFLLSASFAFCSGMAPETRDLINAYKAGKNVKKPQKQKVKSFKEITKDNPAPVADFLFLIQQTVEKKETKDLPDLKRLFEHHRKRTFKEKYGEDAQYVRAYDFDQLYCDAIEKAIKVLEKEKSKKQPTKEKLSESE